MLLSFPNRDHADVLAGEGSLHIGGSSHNDIVLTALRDRHARITRDARGIVLEILDGGARAHVNARPVREKAFVRYGDTVCLDAVTIAVIEPERVDDQPLPGAATRSTAALRGVLRGMSGSSFGKSFPIADGGVVAEQADGAIEMGEGVTGLVLARIDCCDGSAWLVSSEGEGSRVNGRLFSRVRLRSGDQLVFGRERFVVECCATPSVALLPPVQEPDTSSDDAAGLDIEQPGGVGHAVWWLIAAAAAMGLTLAAVLRHGA